MFSYCFFWLSFDARDFGSNQLQPLWISVTCLINVSTRFNHTTQQLQTSSSSRTSISTIQAPHSLLKPHQQRHVNHRMIREMNMWHIAEMWSFQWLFNTFWNQHEFILRSTGRKWCDFTVFYKCFESIRNSREMLKIHWVSKGFWSDVTAEVRNVDFPLVF